MPANTSPIYTLAPRTSWGATAVATANTAKDGTGTVLSVFTAGSNGSFVQKIRFRPSGTATASVARVFINNGSSNATPANNILYDEVSLPAVTLSEVAAQTLVEITLNIALPAAYVLNVTVGTTVAAGYFVSAVGGDY